MTVMNDTPLVLWCLILGNKQNPFKVQLEAPSVADLSDLKAAVHQRQEKLVLREIDAEALILWKLNVPEPIEPADELYKRIQKKGDKLSTFAANLAPAPFQNFKVLFSTRAAKCLDILVELPQGVTIGPSNSVQSRLSVNGRPPPKRQRLEGTDASREHSRSHAPGKQWHDPRPQWLVELHRKLWGRTDLLDKIVRTATLSEDDFLRLQTELESGSELSDSLASVQTTKLAFLYSMNDLQVDAVTSDKAHSDYSTVTTDHAASSSTIVHTPIVGNLSDPSECKDDSSDLTELSDDLPSATPNSLTEALELAPSFFPCEFRYMDLTVLNLKCVPRVPLLMLIRSDWDSVSDMLRVCVPGVEGSVVVTGQPGIGKTCFLYYSLVLRLIRAEHTVFQDTDGFVFLITDQVRNEGHVEGNDVLALVDADGKMCEPSREILNNHNYRILLTSSPRERSDRKWMKQYCPYHGKVLVMEPCSREEVVQIALFLSEFNGPLEQLRAALQVGGNIPRQCIIAAVSARALNRANADIFEAITNIEDVEKAIRNAYLGRPYPHHVFEIYPNPTTRALVHCLVRPVSTWVFNELMNTIKQRDKDAAFKFYKRIQSTPHAATVRGLMWEWHVHHYLTSIEMPTTFRLLSLDDRTNSIEIQFPPHISHKHFGPNRSFGGHLVSSIRDGQSCYLTPLAKNLASIDSVLYLHGDFHDGFQPLLGLQITDSSQHDISVKGLATLQKSLTLKVKQLKALRPSNEQKWIIVFVVPEPMGALFEKQNFDDSEEGNPWVAKTAQYVLELDRGHVFGSS